MSNLIEEEIGNKRKVPMLWHKKFFGVYTTATRKMLGIIFVLAVIYFMVFYTPLVWFLSEPLRISQLPQKADVIVVLAGGVGESGEAGQGYEERVQYAVELFKKGYADCLIFSSGYTYVFKEPQVMKALAVSLDIPEEAIILEDKAGNTYEHVKFTEDILADNGWDKMLLVSSPYHMRRVSLVARKLGGSIKIIYVPIRESRFYSKSNKRLTKQIRPYQIMALLHEYAGIVYYWWKGYI